MVNETGINTLAEGGKNVGIYAGKTGTVIGKFFSTLSIYISNMNIIEWIFLFIIIGGGITVWYLKQRFNLEFSWKPKRPKFTFN